MADAPKDKKAGPAPSTLDPFETFVWYFFVILLAGAVVMNLFGSGGASALSGSATSIWGAIKLFFLAHILPILYILSALVSILFVFGIVSALRKQAAAYKAMNDFYNPPVLPADADAALLSEPKNQAWERVMKHLNSTNQNDWKFAIIEADIMLADLLEAMRYEGDTISDRLKKVEISDFNTLEEAWEAHKIRNQIAHEGADFLLSEREAKRVIELYRKVFAEFKII